MRTRVKKGQVVACVFSEERVGEKVKKSGSVGETMESRFVITSPLKADTK